MRLTIRTNLAMRTLMFCAVNAGQTVRKQDVAEACNASENHLAQVIHKLAQADYITTVRGRSGGLSLRRDAADIRVGEVVRCFESTVPFTECMEGGDAGCPLAGCCRLKCAFADALEAFYASLDRLTIADMVADNTDLTRLLRVA
ncbi:Rrf2 family transcriptional regulator [Pseudorhodobacter sp. E13]|uniref:RrF2 family transcriptional regulator n=1 Tax=Pseudorhodobacter sp. E13 TaxID=2487931 RepID=UPI000F8C3BD8|nr:Rrf2 family transcriptional regulator [Pseudorhodobacter sp. E13]RUS63684.1 Rrf2 family transcriptional regulator [Pseudorhodobacter sp. E13]